LKNDFLAGETLLISQSLIVHLTDLHDHSEVGHGKSSEGEESGQETGEEDGEEGSEESSQESCSSESSSSPSGCRGGADPDQPGNARRYSAGEHIQPESKLGLGGDDARDFRVPGAKTQNCSPATGAIKQRIVSLINVGPFKVSGLDIAVQLLKAVFDEAEQQIPSVVAAVKNDGMLCVRHKRMNPNSFSNHSWGTAIDLFFGTAAVPQGSHKTNRGCLQLAPFFNRHGFYWGAGFSGSSVDSMHFELAEQTIKNPPPKN
jgi:hypothetical protein